MTGPLDLAAAILGGLLVIEVGSSVLRHMARREVEEQALRRAQRQRKRERR